MDYCETGSSARVRVLLTDEELQLAAVDDLCNKYFDWLKLSKESAGGRKTRSANRRVDTIFDEIMSFKLPPIKLRSISLVSPIKTVQSNSTKSSIDGDSESSSVGSSGQNTRTLRPRCRTPSVSRQPLTIPSTPTQQSIRAHLKKNIDSGGSSVLSAALNQQHPSVNFTKIRQLYRADSAQKKREEERERQERLRQDRKAKEERAEAQKKQLLEERAITAKLKREQRLLHAAEVRKAREKARLQQKMKEEQVKKASNHIPVVETTETNHVPDPVPSQTAPQTKEKQKQKSDEDDTPKQNPQELLESQQNVAKPIESLAKAHKLDETFKKPSNDQNNIDISVHDETTDEKTKGTMIAPWAKASELRDAIIKQYSKPEAELLKQALELFMGVKLPVDLDEIFGPYNAVNNRYLCRTSSAVWSPPNRALKRTSSMVMTPTGGSKRER